MEKSNKVIFLERILAWMAKKILKKYKPKIIAISGSVGKTTTKEAVFTLLKHYFKVRQNEKNYNNEIGVPLTIIGSASGDNSLIRWCLVFLRWLRVYIFPGKYPEVLILEMGADKIGDIKYLCQLAPPDIGILTNVGISHLKYFKQKESLKKEKLSLIKNINTDGLAIVNQDGNNLMNIEHQLTTRLISYGISNDKVHMRATDIFPGYKKVVTLHGKEIYLIEGAIFKVNFQGKIIPVKLSHGLGNGIIYATLAALAVGEYFDINLIEAGQKLQSLTPPKGRLNILKGVKNTVIIDDTYNSAPDSLLMAIEIMKKIKAQRKIFVLGDMLELGKEEITAHKQAGRWAKEAKVDILLTVGKRMKLAYREFKRNNHQAMAFHFNNPSSAGLNLQKILLEGDVMLIKGSQGMRMEKIVEEVMAEPKRKKELLVRQTSFWEKKKFKQP